MKRAREIAYAVLEDCCLGRAATVGEALDRQHQGSAPDRRLAREIALGCIRHQRLYDHLADAHLRAGSQPVPLRIGLRIACHQLFALDRVPVHAAVGESVDLVGRRARGLARVANAVLRRLAALRQTRPVEDVVGPERWLDPEALPADPGLRYSLPDCLVRDLAPLVRDGAGDWADLNRTPHLCTRGPTDGVADEDAVLRRDGPWTWWARPAVALQGPVEQGLAVVQDRGQALLMALAEPDADLLVHDCCAAPGGKTRLLRESGCRVIAGDRRLGKIRRVEQASGRLVQDARRPALAAGFDLVVADVPCSNSGVLGRRPEAKWRYDESHLASLAVVQAEILRHAATLVRPGGHLLYSTCSVSPVENRERVAGLSGWQVVGERLNWPDAWQGGGYAALLGRA